MEALQLLLRPGGQNVKTRLVRVAVPAGREQGGFPPPWWERRRVRPVLAAPCPQPGKPCRAPQPLFCFKHQRCTHRGSPALFM